METSTKFSCTELVLVITNCIISKLFLTYPSAFSALGASSAPLLAVCTVAGGAVLMAITSYLYNNRRRDITKLLQSRIWQIIISILIVLMIVLNQALFVRTVSESMKISILPSSPLFFISFVFMLGVVVCSHTGLKSIIRSHSFIVPFTLAMTAILFFSSIGNFDFYNLFPIMGNGGGMFVYIWLLFAYFADFLILLILIPFASEKTSYSKITKYSFTISSIVLILITLLYTLVINYSTSDTFFIPVYRIAQYINYKSFMSRIEAIFTVSWLLSFFATSSLYVYIASMLTGRIFKLKSNRPIIYIASILILCLSMIPPNTSELAKWSNYFSAPRLVIGIILPIAVMAIARTKEAKKK